MPFFSGDVEPRKCFPIHMPSCKNLSYNYTYISKEAQMDIWTPYLKYILNESNKTLCNDLRKQLFCGNFVPPCSIDKEIVSPCRDTCQRYYRNKCDSMWISFGNCSVLPVGSSLDGYCTVHDWHYAKLWPGAYEIEAKRSGTIHCKVYARTSLTKYDYSEFWYVYKSLVSS